MLRIFIIASFLAQPATAETFKSSDGKTTIEAYSIYGHDCFFKTEKVQYTVYDNQTDQQFSDSCAIVYKYSKCLSGAVTSDGACTDAKWKIVTPAKTIMVRKSNKDLCFEKVKNLVETLKKKGFTCTESGIN